MRSRSPLEDYLPAPVKFEVLSGRLAYHSEIEGQIPFCTPEVYQFMRRILCSGGKQLSVQRWHTDGQVEETEVVPAKAKFQSGSRPRSTRHPRL